MYVSIFSFSGVYPDEDLKRISDEPSGGADVRFFDDSFRFFDLSDIEGTNGYLSDEARQKILQRIQEAPVNAVNFIDNGNTHYMTDILCGRVSRPFILILIDHHTDMQPPAFGGLESCGSWVRFALEQNPMLRGVLIIGPDKETADCPRAEYSGKPVMLLPEDMTSAETVSRCVCELQKMCGSVSADRVDDGHSGIIPGIYISIDKDVLDRTEVITNWDQGGMSFGTLSEILRAILDAAGGAPMGIDICGECPPQAQYGADAVSYAADLAQNREINTKLLDILGSYR